MKISQLPLVNVRKNTISPETPEKPITETAPNFTSIYDKKMTPITFQGWPFSKTSKSKEIDLREKIPRDCELSDKKAMGKKIDELLLSVPDKEYEQEYLDRIKKGLTSQNFPVVCAFIENEQAHDESKINLYSVLCYAVHLPQQNADLAVALCKLTKADGSRRFDINDVRNISEETTPKKYNFLEKLLQEKDLDGDYRFSFGESIGQVLRVYSPEKQPAVDMMLPLTSTRQTYSANALSQVVNTYPEEEIYTHINEASASDKTYHRFSTHDLEEILKVYSPEKEEALKIMLEAKTQTKYGAEVNRFNSQGIGRVLEEYTIEKHELFEKALRVKDKQNKPLLDAFEIANIL